MNDSFALNFPKSTERHKRAHLLKRLRRENLVILDKAQPPQNSIHADIKIRLNRNSSAYKGLGLILVTRLFELMQCNRKNCPIEKFNIPFGTEFIEPRAPPSSGISGFFPALAGLLPYKLFALSVRLFSNSKSHPKNGFLSISGCPCRGATCPPPPEAGY